MTSEVEELVKAFVEAASADRESGHTVAKLHTKVDDLRGAVAKVSDGLAAHMLECQHARESAALVAASTNLRLVTLEAKKGSLKPPPPATIAPSLPPIRSEADSSHELHATADKLTNALYEGMRDPNKTPEEAIKKAVAEIEEEKRRERRLAELEAADTARGIAAAQHEERQRQRRLAMRKLAAQLAIAVVSGGGLWQLLGKAIGHR
jgi:hypothetical protein